MITMNEYNLFKPKYYLCLSLFDENRKQTNTEKQNWAKKQNRKEKSVLVCEGVVWGIQCLYVYTFVLIL